MPEFQCTSTFFDNIRVRKSRKFGCFYNEGKYNKKYGKENFKVELLECSNSKEKLNRLEKHYIELFNSVLDTQYYNIHEGGAGGDTWSGRKHTEKSKSKMSKSKKGKQSPHKGKKFRPLTDEEKITKSTSSPKRKEININGTRYRSYRDASKKLGVRVRSYTIEKLKEKGFVII